MVISAETNFGTEELRDCMFGTDFGNFTNFGTKMFGTFLALAYDEFKFGTTLLPSLVATTLLVWPSPASGHVWAFTNFKQ